MPISVAGPPAISVSIPISTSAQIRYKRRSYPERSGFGSGAPVRDAQGMARFFAPSRHDRKVEAKGGAK